MADDNVAHLPTISIITPSFNQAQFIEQNIQSVLRQRYPKVEHIIVDGGSTDGTLNVLRRHPYLKWVSEPDRGQTHALNKGFRMATGDIVGWLNSDDTYCDNVFRAVAEKFGRPEVMAVYGHGFEVDEQGNVLRPLYTRGMTADNLIEYWKWKYEYVQPSFFFRRSLLDEIGDLDESLYYIMDYDLFLRICLRHNLDCLDMPLANFRMYGHSKTGQKIHAIIPGWIWELHKVSRRHWGSAASFKYYGYLLSFLVALLFSVVKNVFFVPGSKIRTYAARTFGKPRL